MNRRLMMAAAKPKAEDVRFWLSGEDAAVAVGNVGYWYERIQNVPFAISGSNVYNPSLNLYDFSANNANAKVTSTDVNKYNFGNHWKMFFDMDAVIFNSNNNDKYFFDFGSVGTSNHAFGFNMALNKNSQRNVGVNWKINGNSSNPGIGSLAFPIDTTDWVVGQYLPVKGHFAILPNGDYDKLEIEINGISMTSNVNIPKAQYNSPWNMQQIAVGSSIHSNTSFKCPCKIRELKIICLD